MPSSLMCVQAMVLVEAQTTVPVQMDIQDPVVKSQFALVSVILLPVPVMETVLHLIHVFV